MRETEDKKWEHSIMKQRAKGDIKGISHGMSILPVTLIMDCGRCSLINIGTTCEVKKKLECTLFCPYRKTEK